MEADVNVLAKKFIRPDLRSANGTEGPWEIGVTKRLEGELKICERGYHHSDNWLDALGYARQPVAALVEASEPESPELRHTDKGCSRELTIVEAHDASRELRLFAADCAERALLREREGGREPDVRSWAALEAARAFVAGTITKDQLRNAAAAAAAAYAAYAAYAANAAAAAAAAAAYAAYAAYAANAAANAANAANAAAAAYAAKSKEGDWQRQRLAEYLDPLFAEVVGQEGQGSG